MSCRQRLFAWFLLAACIAVAIMSRPAYAVPAYQDSGYVEAWPEPELPELTVEDAVICLHEDVHLLVRGIIPFGTAVLILVLGCVWFYCTFIKI